MSNVEIIRGPKNDADSQLFTASSFLEYLRKSQPRWTKRQNHGQRECGWVFRGHCDSNFQLVPSAARRTERDKRLGLFNHFKSLITGRGLIEKTSPDGVLHLEQLAEVLMYDQLLGRFAQLGSDMGFFSDSINGFQRSHQESKLNAASRAEQIAQYLNDRNFAPFSIVGADDRKTGSYFDLLGLHQLRTELCALAQHHGVPTYLLDWTENPLIAAYFATGELSASETDICVWALNLDVANREIFEGKNVNDHNTGIVKISWYKPSRFQNQFMSSQQGGFTYINGRAVNWNKVKEFPCLEDVVRGYSQAPFFEMTNDESQLYWQSKFQEHLAQTFPHDMNVLRKVVLTAEHVPDLRQLLKIEDISLVHLMPTLDNLARTSNSLVINDIKVHLGERQ